MTRGCHGAYGERVPPTVLPSDLDGCHVLALPAGADVRSLVVAWFGDGAWEVLPVGPDPMTALTVWDERSRAAVWAAPPRPGRLRLTAHAGLVGPRLLGVREARAQGLPGRDLDLYALDPEVRDPLVLGWMTAAARRTGGAVVSADRTQVVVPDAGAAVDLTLWTGTVLSPSDLLTAVRPFLAGSRLGPVAQQESGAYSVTSTFEFDGALTLAVQRRDEVPVAVASLPWGDQGPWAYAVTWAPPDPSELTVEQPSRLHLIARTRVVPVVARAARAMLQIAGGIVVDDGGFPVPEDELAARGTRL